MASIGPQLKSARESLGISVPEAAKRLHIRAMFVDALERDEWRSVGEPVYVRGFIRNYARLVALDPADLVEAFNATEYAGSASTAELYAPPLEPRRRFRYPWLLAGMTFFALLLVARVVWTMAVPGTAGHNEMHPAPASAMTTAASAAAPSDGAVTESAMAASKTQSASGVNLRLELTQSCWLSVSVDGKRVVYQTLPAGTVKEFHGVREISLRAGNAGGVVATIDGQPLGALGSPGQVKDRVFAVKTPPIGQSGTHE
jgi:cytoskeleton protein RodZ